ncbi:MAG: flippase-like domain-containing protein [Frankia sp.]|nr:flippase-like domain-containing protein [Frankia sp.]
MPMLALPAVAVGAANPAGAVAGNGTGGGAVLPRPGGRLAARRGGGALEVPARLRPALRMPRRRTLIVAAVLGVPLAFLAVRFRTEVSAQLANIPAPSWPWLVLGGFGSLLYYTTNGLALRAGSGLPLGVGVSTSVQIAAAAANRVVPAGLGAIAVNLRFLECRGLSRPAGLAAITSTKVANGLVHFAAIGVVAGLLGDSEVTSAVTRPLRGTMSSLGTGPACVVAVAVVVVLAVVLSRRWVRARLRAPLAAFRAHLSSLLHSPGRASALIASLAGTKVAQVIALDSSVRAFGGSVDLLSVAAVYLVGSAVAGAAPTAGNVGAIEPALAIGLTAAGAPAAAALAAVLVYRLIGYWLPVLPGLVVLGALRRRGDL